MKKQLCILLFQCLFSVFAFGKTVTLEEALRLKWVTSTITNHGGIQVSLTNLTKEGFLITLPVGLVFRAQDSTFQDFIHLENKEVGMAALGTYSVKVNALCIRAARRCPIEGAVFYPKNNASSNLLALVTFAFAQKLYNNNAMQYALWAVSDNNSLVGIDNQPLVKFVAHLLNKPLPEYFVEYKQREVVPAPTPQRQQVATVPQRTTSAPSRNISSPPSQRQVVYEAAEATIEPLAIKATLQYTLPIDQQVKLDLVDDKGKSVLAEYNMVETMNQTKGKHRFNFKLELTGVPRGTYFMKMTSTSDGKEWASLKVTF
jgi:hypothetical protein